MFYFSQLDCHIDVTKNQILSKTPIKEFFESPCLLLGKCSAKGLFHYQEWAFVHKFNPGDMKPGRALDYTNLEILVATKQCSDLKDKVFSALAFNRNENKIVSMKEWSIWASDQFIETRWKEQLIIEYNTVPLFS